MNRSPGSLPHTLFFRDPPNEEAGAQLKGFAPAYLSFFSPELGLVRKYFRAVDRTCIDRTEGMMLPFQESNHTPKWTSQSPFHPQSIGTETSVDRVYNSSRTCLKVQKPDGQRR